MKNKKYLVYFYTIVILGLTKQVIIAKDTITKDTVCQKWAAERQKRAQDDLNSRGFDPMCPCTTIPPYKGQYITEDENNKNICKTTITVDKKTYTVENSVYDDVKNMSEYCQSNSCPTD